MSDTTNNNEETDPFLSAEMTDRAKRKEAKKKAKEESKPKAAPKDELDEAIAQSSFAQKKKKQNIKLMKRGAIGLVLALFVWWAAGLFKPYEAGKPYGICRVFLETTVRYPTEMRLSTVENFAGSVRIWYAQIDPFGDYRLENIQCFYERDEKTGARLSRVTINRREYDPEKVAAFNKVLPVVLQNMPDLAYPNPLPDSLRDLQIQTDMFRKSLF